MLTNEETHYCSQCSEETKHIVVLVREAPAENKLKDFFKGFIKSAAVGAFESAMDDFSRHSICEVCGKKTINDNLT
jgi:ribosomal protein L44E